MAKESPALKFAKENDLVDERELVYVADIVCSNGNYGRAWIFFGGNNMHIFELVGFSGIGGYVETIELKNAEVLKSSAFLLGPSLKLKYDGNTYTFKNFAQPKLFIGTVREGCAEL